MPDVEITKSKQGLTIDIKDIAGQEIQLLGAFQACQQGQCNCPTDEYKKLESMEVTQADAAIHIQLVALEGTTLDTQEIARCLEFTTQATVPKEDK